MNVEDMRTMCLAELQELRSVEDQLVTALPDIAELAQHPELREALGAIVLRRGRPATVSTRSYKGMAPHRRPAKTAPCKPSCGRQTDGRT